MKKGVEGNEEFKFDIDVLGAICAFIGIIIPILISHFY